MYKIGRKLAKKMQIYLFLFVSNVNGFIKSILYGQIVQSNETSYKVMEKIGSVLVMMLLEKRQRFSLEVFRRHLNNHFISVTENAP